MENLIFYETERKSKRVKTFKRLLMMMAAIMMALVTFSSCNEDDDPNKDPDEIENGGEEKPGQISGMGNNTGKIDGKAFVLPDGIVFDGDLSGIEWESLSNTYQMSLIVDKSEKKSALYSILTNEITTRSIKEIFNYKYDMFGSGLNVNILIPLKNNTSRQINVEFPALLTFESSNSKYQHGILLKKVIVSVPANTTYRIVLQLYCCNKDRDMPDSSTKFLKPVVSNSKQLLYLSNLVKNKRINVEEVETMEQWSEYVTIATALQEMVWKVTDYGKELDNADLAYIASLPESRQ